MHQEAFAFRLGRRAVFAGGGAAAIALAADAARAQQPEAAQRNGPHLTPAVMQANQNWAASLALQAATYAAPIVAMYNLRAAVAFGPKSKAAPGQIWLFDDIATPEIARQTGYVTPNVNVLYGFGFADLGQQPHILTAPDSAGRYYMIQLCDMWTNSFAYPAGARAGYEGGTFALVGPGWSGTLPPGLTRIDCPTRWVEVQPRVYVKDAADLPAARKVLHAVKLQTLSDYTGAPGPARAAYDYPAPDINPDVASSQMQFLDPMQFWSIFAAAMNENPPPASEIASVLPQYRHLGIELGKPFSPEGVNPIFLGEMRRVVQEFGPMALKCGPLLGTLINGWSMPLPDQGLSGADYMSRALVAVIGLTANAVQEALYYPGFMDSTGAALSGQKRYVMTFTPGLLHSHVVPPGFWSVTLYDSLTHYTADNPLGRYKLGSDDDVAKNADGSFAIYVQHDDPGPDKRSNWLPAPAGPFYLMLRNYSPAPEVIKALREQSTAGGPPPIVPVG